MNIFESPLVTGVILGAIAIVPATLVYRHSKKADDAAEETGSVAQVLDGLNKIIELYRSDSVTVRARVDLLDVRLEQAAVALTTCVDEREKLQAQLATLERKVADLEHKYGP